MTHRSRASRALALGALVTIAQASFVRASFGAGTDPPARTDTAASHFKHGVALYKEGDYEGALVEFRRAQDLTPNYRVLYDIGQSLYQLQRYADALKAFEDYLAQGGTQLAPARRASVEADLKALRARVGHLEIVVNVDGAEVRIDDQVVGTSPLAAPILVSVGHRKITVAKADRVSVEKFVDIAVGDRAKIVFDLPAPIAIVPGVATTPASSLSASGKEGAAPLVTPSQSPPPAPEARQGGSLTWVPWATTGVLAVATGVTGALALESKGALTNDLATFPGDPNAINQDRNRAKSFSIASDVLLGATAISLGVALYVTLRPHPNRSGEVIGRTTVRLGLDGVRIQGDF
jgi:hypothetical protein